MPAPRESPSTLVVVRRRSLGKDREEGKMGPSEHCVTSVHILNPQAKCLEPSLKILLGVFKTASSFNRHIAFIIIVAIKSYGDIKSIKFLVTSWSNNSGKWPFLFSFYLKILSDSLSCNSPSLIPAVLKVWSGDPRGPWAQNCFRNNVKMLFALFTLIFSWMHSGVLQRLQHNTKDTTTDWMQRQLGDYSCLVLSKTLRRFTKM